MMKSRATFVGLLLCCMFNVQAATYHVSIGGNDNDPGSQSQPWASISHAASIVTVGDTVLVGPGTYAENVYVGSSGVSGAPIRFESVGEVTMEGFILNGDYLHVKGFRVRTLTCDGQDSYGIEVRGDNFLIEGNDIYEMPDGGIQTGANSDNGEIRGNRLERNIQAGIELHGNNHLVIDNEIIHPLERHPVTACRNGADDANGIAFFGTGHVIRSNFVHDITYADPNVLDAHADCFQTYGSWIAGEFNDNLLVEDNVCEALAYQTEDENGNGLYIEDVDNLTIRNNVFRTYIGVGAGPNVTNLEIINNTFVSAMDIGGVADDHIGLDIWNAGTSGGMIRNNIFVDFRGGPYYLNSQNQTTANDHNLMHWTDGQDRSQTWWRFKCAENGNVCADPLLADIANLDFRPASNSPAIDVGSDLVVVTDDIEGTSRPQGAGFDMGAYEQQTGPVSPQAGFSASPVSGEVPLVVQFSDQSSGLPTNWSWDFGDGDTSSVQHPQHTYNVVGAYSVSLTVSNAQGNDTLTQTNMISVIEPSLDEILFEDGFEPSLGWISSGEADWYSGSPKAETHAARLRRTGAIETGVSTLGFEGIRLDFQMGAKSLDKGTEYVAAEWSDGSNWFELTRITDGEEDSLLHAYSFTLPSSADHNSGLKLRFAIYGSGSADYGYIDEVLVTGIPAEPPALPPIADFDANVTSGPADLVVSFNDLSVDASGWLWDFGDGDTDSVQNPVHTYTTPGTYDVALTVANQHGSDTLTRAGWIQVDEPAQSGVIATEDFSSGLSAWYIENRVVIKNGIANLKKNNVWMMRKFSTVGFSNIRLNLLMGGKSYEAGESLVLYWSTGDGNWEILHTIVNGSADEDGQLHPLEFVLPAGASDNPDFAVAFGQWAAGKGDVGLVDDIVISGTGF